jgi:hypothetical protein
LSELVFASEPVVNPMLIAKTMAAIKNYRAIYFNVLMRTS